MACIKVSCKKIALWKFRGVLNHVRTSSQISVHVSMSRYCAVVMCTVVV